ncbi:MAG: histidine phosphatase family protein [Gammaproteobacteria bacterium]|nr:histidine phosphatase family protein [Gammaproteobacteria bacterium]
MREKEPSASVLLIRHGKTDFPLDRIYCDDREDPGLNDEGEVQAQGAAKLLKGIAIDALYCSPSLRTLRTAEIIAADCGLKFDQRDALRERRFGIFEGLYFHEIAERYPEEQAQWKKDNAGFKPRGGESIYDLWDRISPVFDEIIECYRGKTVAVVTHVGPIRIAAAQAIGLPVPNFRRLSIDYASVTRIDYGRTQNNMAFLNRIV